MVLRDCPPGRLLRLRRIVADHIHGRRLAEMGLVPGAVLRVVGRAAFGGLIVAVGDSRLALDADTGRCLVVEPAMP